MGHTPQGGIDQNLQQLGQLLFFSVTYIYNQIHTVPICIYLYSLRPLSFSSLHVAQREKPPWAAEPRFELWPAIQQASKLPRDTGQLLSCDGAVAEGRLELGPPVISDFH